MHRKKTCSPILFIKLFHLNEKGYFFCICLFPGSNNSNSNSGSNSKPSKSGFPNIFLNCPLVKNTLFRGVGSFTISTSVSKAVLKDFPTNYMKALGLSYILIKLRNNYYTYTSINMFICINSGKYIKAINKTFIRFFLYLDNTDDFR